MNPTAVFQGLKLRGGVDLRGRGTAGMVDNDSDRMLGRRTLLAGTGAAVMTALSGCVGDVVDAGDEVRETRVEQFDAADLAALSVDTPNGRIHVEGEDRETIDLRAEKRAGTQQALESATLSVDRADGRLSVSVDVDRSIDLDGSTPRVDVELTVPSTLRLARADGVNGDVDVGAVAGDLVAETTNGDVTVSDVDGAVHAESTNGDVRVEDVAGDVAVETTNGDVDVTTVAGDATVDTVTGSVDVADVARAAWDSVETPASDLEVTATGTVSADASRLTQLFENLFRNAVEHGPRLDADPADGHARPGVTVTVGALPDGLYVADDGVGIPAAEREAAFESGYTTAEDGTGFGLDIVTEIVEAHGWTIDLRESAGGGARFEIGGMERDTPD